MDRSGSHVAETALKSLSVHLQDYEARSIVEETLTMICQVQNLHDHQQDGLFFLVLYEDFWSWNLRSYTS